MTGERESPQDLEDASKLDQAKEAVQAVTNTVKATSQTIADAIDAGRNPLIAWLTGREKRLCIQSPWRFCWVLYLAAVAAGDACSSPGWSGSRNGPGEQYGWPWR
jgi:hypothetical protein